MANTFDISVKSDIAAVSAIVQANQTEIAAIRGADLATLVGEINANELLLDSILDPTLVNLASAVANNAVSIGVIDGIADAIKLKTDIIPQKVRGSLKYAFATTTSAELIELLNVTGQGSLFHLGIFCTNGGDTIELKLTVDGTAWDVTTHTGDTVRQMVFPYPLSFNGRLLIKSVSPDVYGSVISIDFDTSLLVEFRRSAGAVSTVNCSCFYILDNF